MLKRRDARRDRALLQRKKMDDFEIVKLSFPATSGLRQGYLGKRTRRRFPSGSESGLTTEIESDGDKSCQL